ncbi:hypothetical protein CCR75_002098 [Bremia lactucae]|uniref:Uncharacterized protein n=1 Tax=Bremia lactucae TaxID=4779 RepID=A0A976FNA1_BRELC|nr:hypothetical protein CCR75_002098 [Bremia lactucae]
MVRPQLPVVGLQIRFGEATTRPDVSLRSAIVKLAAYRSERLKGMASLKGGLPVGFRVIG